MKYVFKILSNKVKESIKKDEHGNKYYVFPMVKKDNSGYKIFHVRFPAEKVNKINGNYYFVLDTQNLIREICLDSNPNQLFTEKDILDYLKDDYFRYINTPAYNISPNLPYAIRNYTPIGIEIFDNINNKPYVDKWTFICNKISKKYDKSLVAISPIVNDKIYPFHYKNFLEDKYIREYLSNVIMFSLTYDSNYRFDNKPNYAGNYHIYYQTPFKKIPVFEMINEKKFYYHCLNKDNRTNASRPFLKSFTEKAINEKTIKCMNDDPICSELVKKTYATLRNEMNLKSKQKVYFVPSLDTNLLINYKLQYNKNKFALLDSELKTYQAAIEQRLVKFAQAFDKYELFYFDSDHLDYSDGKIKVNSALKKYINTTNNDIYYNPNTKTVYVIEENNHKDRYYPVLEVLTKKELDLLKEDVYNKWLEMKMKKFGR